MRSFSNPRPKVEIKPKTFSWGVRKVDKRSVPLRTLLTGQRSRYFPPPERERWLSFLASLSWESYSSAQAPSFSLLNVPTFRAGSQGRAPTFALAIM